MMKKQYFNEGKNARITAEVNLAINHVPIQFSRLRARLNEKIKGSLCSG